MSSEKFCLKWNEYESNLSKSFDELRNEKDFFDVTLICEDTQIEAHKLILGACSTFFKNVLRRTNHHHPMLYLKGVLGKDLMGILNFLYRGETKVAEQDLNSFLSVAEELKVKGLTQCQHEGKSSEEKEKLPVASKIKTEKVYSIASEPAQDELEFQDMSSVAVAGEETEYDDQDYSYQEFDYETSDENHDLIAAREEAIRSHIYKDDQRKMFACNLCSFAASSRYKAFCHIEAKHYKDDSITYTCKLCGKSASSRNALGSHMTREHKENKY